MLSDSSDNLSGNVAILAPEDDYASYRKQEMELWV